MLLVLQLLLLSLIGYADAIRCYQGTEWIHMKEIKSAYFECPISAITCTKFVDYDTSMVTRGCHVDECYGVRRGSEFCRNYTQIGRNEEICCCYGDGCNSSSNLQISVVLLAIFYIVVI